MSIIYNIILLSTRGFNMINRKELQEKINDTEYLDSLLINNMNPFSKIKDIEAWDHSNFLYHFLALNSHKSYDYFVNKWKQEYHYKMNKLELRMNIEEISELTFEHSPLWFIEQHKSFLRGVFLKIDRENILTADDFLNKSFNNQFSIHNLVKYVDRYRGDSLDSRLVRKFIAENIKKFDFSKIPAKQISNMVEIFTPLEFSEFFMDTPENIKFVLSLIRRQPLIVKEGIHLPCTTEAELCFNISSCIYEKKFPEEKILNSIKDIEICIDYLTQEYSYKSDIRQIVAKTNENLNKIKVNIEKEKISKILLPDYKSESKLNKKRI